MTFAQKLRQLRDAVGLSEAKLAKASGLPFGTVHDYGLGRRTPSLLAAVKLAAALGVDCRVWADCDDVNGTPPAKSSGMTATSAKRKLRKGAM